MPAPVCGCSIMSLRSVVLKRPLRARSLPTSCATSNDAAAASGELKGTIAIGMASACPLVISTTSSAHEREQNAKQPIASKHKRRLFIWVEPENKVSLEQRRILWFRQGRCTIHRILDRLTGGCIAVALGDARARYLAARNLGHCDQAVKTHARRRGLDPGILDFIAQLGDIAVAQGTGLHGAAVLLVGQLPPQFSLPIRLRPLIGRMLGIRNALLLGCLFRLRGLLRLRGLSRCGVGVGLSLRLLRKVGLRRPPRLLHLLLLGRRGLGG